MELQNKREPAVEDNGSDGPEFTDEQLRAALERVGRNARAAAFAAGRPVVVIKNDSLVELYPDGSEKILRPLLKKTGAGANK
jgi:hypothetical protein